MTLESSIIRNRFPALQSGAIFLDNPGGTQIALSALERMEQYLTTSNANHGGAFRTSQESDRILDAAHAAMADFYNAARPEEIVFGNNMTSLTLHISRSLARTWKEGDTIVVTRLDHDANITPWVLAAEDRGVRVRWVDFHPEDGTLDLDDLQAALEEKPRLLAVGYASNALGTINPLEEIIPMAHAAGALVYVDAVQYAAHGPIDVQALGCDFLVASSYKFFGPHAGILYGRYNLLDSLFAYKVRPASNTPPGKFETGTQNHEGIAGVLGTMEYLEWLGETFGGEFSKDLSPHYKGRRMRLKQAMAAIRAYEYRLSRNLLDVLKSIRGLTLYGLSDPRRIKDRVPTFAFRLNGQHPREVAVQLGREDIYVWDGNYYALAVTERLGVEDKGGMVRVGAVHYNTERELKQLGDVLERIARTKAVA
ncbi:cysteine desulfurase-like protein [Bellilinea sp.]|uniref:Cysteine desulfurase-like protein n=1 Tax=Bellilinea caldifistulae TaxID=360411 RepID=A0A7C4L0C1_9CHLR